MHWQTVITKLREEKATLLARLDEINDKLPMEQPKESSKKGKQMKKLVKEREEEERKKAEEKLLEEERVSLQRRIEESDFDNAQDMFGGGGKGGAGAVGGDSGKFESWPLGSGTKQPEVGSCAHQRERLGVQSRANARLHQAGHPRADAPRDVQVEEFAVYTAAKITKFEKEFLYMALCGPPPAAGACSSPHTSVECGAADCVRCRT